MPNMFIKFSDSRRATKSQNGRTQSAHADIQTLRQLQTFYPALAKKSQQLKLQAFICSDICTLRFCNSLLFLTNVTKARTSTSALRETVIDRKLIPMGDKPKNKPTNPVKPKLSATDNTNSSTKSILFLPKNSKFTKQQPGRNEIKTKLRTYRGTKTTEKSGLLGIK